MVTPTLVVHPNNDQPTNFGVRKSEPGVKGVVTGKQNGDTCGSDGLRNQTPDQTDYGTHMGHM